MAISLTGIFVIVAKQPPIDIFDTRGENRLQLYLRVSRNRKKNNIIQGHPLTSQRSLLLELLKEADGHIDAKELYRRASYRDESISPATIYRTLNLFRELGLIDEMRLDRVRCCYEIKQSKNHQHLLCRGCGKVIEFDSPLIRKLTDTVQQRHGFKATKIQLYLEGYCQKCDTGKKSNSPGGL